MCLPRVIVVSSQWLNLISICFFCDVSWIELGCLYPADTWGLYNVASTSMQRHDVASTLIRRCINVMCPLGIKANSHCQTILCVYDSFWPECQFQISEQFRYVVKVFDLAWNISEATQEMSQSRSTASPRYQRKESWEQIKTKRTPRVKPQTHEQKRTATEEPLWNGL